VESDPEAFDCETCEYRQRTEALGSDDHLALRTYGLLAGRAVRDLRLTPMVFDILGVRFRGRREAAEFLGRLEAIHDVRSPVEGDELKIDKDE
jgi:hypothetical protein